MNIFALIPFFSFFASGALCGVVWSHRPLLRTHMLLGIMLTFIMIWAFSSFVLHANFFPEQAVWWYGSVALCVIGTATAYYHFSRTFVEKSAGIGVYFGYGVLILVMLLITSGYFIKTVYTMGGLIYTE